MFKVGLLVDEVASLMSTPEEEYAEHEANLRENVFGKHPVKFIRDITADKVSSYGLDLYLFDFGGLAAQSFGNVNPFLRRYVDPMVKAIAETPSTYFLVWSDFTKRYMKEGYFDLLGIDDWDDKHWPSNVILWPEGYDNFEPTWRRLRGLLSIPEPAPLDLKKYRARRKETPE